MAEPPRPVFYARRAYRLRRLADLSRALPLAGAILLILVPVLWSQGTGPTTSRAILWLFGVWAVMVGVAAWLAALRIDAAPDLRDGSNAAQPPRPAAKDPAPH